MNFVTGVPGLSRYAPTEPSWAYTMTSADFQKVARTADEVGYGALLVPEHIVLPEELATTMGAHWPHALTAMAFLAGATNRIKVLSAVVILPAHNPIVLAKAIATLDVLSGGRVIVAVGVGHAEAEFDALGISFKDRGRMADEFLEAMPILWGEDDPVFHGRFVNFEGIRFEPKPLQKPHPPLWIGGSSAAAVRRAARFGQGWFPHLVSEAELAEYLATLRADPQFGDPQRPFDVMLSVSPVRVREGDHRPIDGGTGAPIPPLSAEWAVDAVGRLAELGVTWTTVLYPGPPARSLEEHLDRLAWVAEEIIARTR
jgi:probable F420-dependent oxidoreductase